MPSYKKIVTACAEMTDTALTWDMEEQSSSGSLVIKAIGSSPSDETVRVTSIYVEENQSVKEGDLLASVEADKASMDISAPSAGTLQEIHATEGDELTVGASLFTLQSDVSDYVKPVTEENCGIPRLTPRRPVAANSTTPVQAQAPQHFYLSSLTTVLGLSSPHQ